LLVAAVESSVVGDGGAVGALPQAEEPAVFARTTIIQGDPARLDEGIMHVRDQVLPEVTRMDGCLGMSMLVDRESGRTVVTTAWESRTARDESLDKVRPMREAAEHLMASGPSEVYQWEVAAVHRDHPVPDGAGVRLTWIKAGDTGDVDRLIDVYKMGVLPRLQEIDGFCSASLFIDRESGRGVGTVILDRRDQLERTRETARGIRGRAMNEMGVTVEDVEELEVAFAHLHVPEMA
jgi:quinol monooxygenase YgiN